uniref:Oligomycin sensitivity conferral protein n=1 Tax=Evadne anonyx TaxID=141404 RepID=A0A9N6ZEA1_9CRUS|nr:EOG090X0EB8 [Evadne anonyx]
MAASTKFAVLARNFSSSPANAALVKPPVQVFGLEGRYASALYSAASKQKSLEKVEKELKTFQQTVAKDERLAEFIKNPILKRSLKVEALASVAKKQNMTPLSTNLLAMMAENGRLDMVDGVINSYKTIMAAYRGEVTCQITSAKPLDSASLKEIEAALNGFLQKGQTLQMTAVVDPAIVGGLLVVIGDRYIDMSLATKLQRYTALKR